METTKYEEISKPLDLTKTKLNETTAQDTKSNATTERETNSATLNPPVVINNNTTYQQQLSPFVYWAQTERQITLKVDLKDSTNALANFSPKSISFKAHGRGARGINDYAFDLRLFGLIDNDESSYRTLENKIEFQIKKMEPGWWPRLVATPQKPHWLRVDFDRWRIEDDYLDEEQRDVMQDYGSEYQRLQRQEIGYIKESTKKVYLMFYNMAMLVGFLYILIVMAVLYYRDGEKSMPKTFETVGSVFKFCQLLQYLEVLHPIFGYTKGGPLMPFFQISGRNFILLIMIDLEPRMQTKPVVFYVFCIWSLIEIVRYSYYLTQLKNCEIGLITWLRYTLWIPLYPMGILCEGIIILRNIPYFEETQKLSVSMPNALNFTFDMVVFLKVYLLLLILPGTYLVMTHMAKQRTKKVGTRNSNGGGRTIRRHLD